jgi:hypothetical protein
MSESDESQRPEPGTGEPDPEAYAEKPSGGDEPPPREVIVSMEGAVDPSNLGDPPSVQLPSEHGQSAQPADPPPTITKSYRERATGVIYHTS